MIWLVSSSIYICMISWVCSHQTPLDISFAELIDRSQRKTFAGVARCSPRRHLRLVYIFWSGTPECDTHVSAKHGGDMLRPVFLYVEANHQKISCDFYPTFFVRWRVSFLFPAIPPAPSPKLGCSDDIQREHGSPPC